MNQKMAKLKQIDKFDGLYFGIVGLMADQIDPQGRLLLETTYEAIVDAGIYQAQLWELFAKLFSKYDVLDESNRIRVLL